MANIHQYANQSDYAAAIDRPNNESNISLVGNTVVADGVNVVVTTYTDGTTSTSKVMK